MHGEQCHDVPTQTQLFAFYMHQCTALNIAKPNQHVLDLLEEENYNRRRQVDHVLGRPAFDNGALDSEVVANVPLRQRRSIPDMFRVGHLGTRGMLAFVELLSECPCLEVFDVSEVPNIYVVDAYKNCVPGSLVVERIAKFIASHGSLTTVNIKGHAIGTIAASMLLEAIKDNGRITSLLYDTQGVAESVNREIARQLLVNVCGDNPSTAPRQEANVLSQAMRSVAFVDRKSSAERLSLRTLLNATFGAASLFGDEVLNTSSLITLGEAALRGSKDHLYLISHGAIELSFGPVTVLLQRGDYFGEPVEDVLHSSGLMTVVDRGTAFAIPLSSIVPITNRWSQHVKRHLPIVRNVPLFQPLHMWVLCRLCHSLTEHTFAEGTSVSGQPDAASLEGLCLVTKGSLRAISDKLPSTEYATFGVLDLVGHDVLLGKGFHVQRTLMSADETTVIRFDDGVVRRHVIPTLRESLMADIASIHI